MFSLLAACSQCPTLGNSYLIESSCNINLCKYKPSLSWNACFRKNDPVYRSDIANLRDVIQNMEFLHKIHKIISTWFNLSKWFTRILLLLRIWTGCLLSVADLFQTPFLFCIEDGIMEDVIKRWGDQTATYLLLPSCILQPSLENFNQWF